MNNKKIWKMKLIIKEIKKKQKMEILKKYIQQMIIIIWMKEMK
jgi:hypothetical protein